MNAVRPRIFISCGQKDAEEREIASRLKEETENLGYSSYVTVYEQSTESLMQNILPILRDCEYFIFIDFQRERIKDQTTDGKHRGSLFTNQELAIAIYLKKEIIAFQQSGIARDGMLNAIQGNAIQFQDRSKLIGDIISMIRKRWRTGWRNELVVTDKKDVQIPYTFVYYSRQPLEIKRPSRFFHITVRNNHFYNSAKNCIAFLESYKKISTRRDDNEKTELTGQPANDNTIKNLEPVELKWKGVTTQGVLIAPHTQRNFDAVFIFEENPSVAYAGTNYTLVDYSDYDIKIDGPGIFELDFVVYSDNFSPITESFVLEFGTGLDDVQFFRK